MGRKFFSKAVDKNGDGLDVLRVVQVGSIKHLCSCETQICVCVYSQALFCECLLTDN